MRLFRLLLCPTYDNMGRYRCVSVYPFIRDFNTSYIVGQIESYLVEELVMMDN